MHHIYHTYLQMIEHTFEGKIQSQDEAALFDLARKHFTAPFLLPYLDSGASFQDLKYQTKMMMFLYYLIELFTKLPKPGSYWKSMVIFWIQKSAITI